MRDLAVLGVLALWLALIQLCAHASRLAAPLKRRELWRTVMAGLVGLASTFEREGIDDDR